MSLQKVNKISHEFFQTLDVQDELSHFRDEFHLSEGLIYLDGNSLGAMPKAAKKRIVDVVEREWAEDLIISWNKNNWFHLAEMPEYLIIKLI